MTRKNHHTVFLSVVMLMIFTAAQGFAIRSPRTRQRPEKDELVERFNKILAEKLKAKHVSVSEDAAKDLDKIVENAAKQIIEKQQFNKLDEADKNFKEFAKALVARGKQPFVSEIEITPKTIDEVLNGRLNPFATDPTQKRTGGLCPLFPIC